MKGGSVKGGGWVGHTRPGDNNTNAHFDQHTRNSVHRNNMS